MGNVAKNISLGREDGRPQFSRREGKDKDECRHPIILMSVCGATICVMFSGTWQILSFSYSIHFIAIQLIQFIPIKMQPPHSRVEVNKEVGFVAVPQLIAGYKRISPMLKCSTL